MADGKSTKRTRPTISDKEALDFHSMGRPGKIEIVATKPMATQRDLSLAYSPGVAVPVKAIAENPALAFDYTAKGNLVAVISNGTAILGLGNLGALASKPVMEGKAVLFKRFADVDSIDLEVDTEDPEQFINAVRYLGPSFGGINLEDIKAPECFIIEEKLRELMDIPVFHDDQHGTAIIAAAGIMNAMKLTGRALKTTKLVCNGAGAAGIACLTLLAETDAVARAAVTAADLRAGLNDALATAGVKWSVYGTSSGFHLFMNPQNRDITPHDFDPHAASMDELKTQDSRLNNRMRLAMLVGGVDLNPRLGGFTSSTHTAQDVADTVAAFAEALRMLKTEGELPN